MIDNRVLAWFSCGAASAVAAKMALARWPGRVEVVNCDTRASEHEDNYRFCRDVEAWLGQGIKFIKSEKYGEVEEVFKATRYMAGVGGARCTTELKKAPRLKYARADDINVFGFTADEGKRIGEFEARNPDMRLVWVLKEAGVRKEDCYRILREAGIGLPAMYRLGFNNNNCIGCVKASSPWYWDRIRELFPDVWARRAKQSREIGCRLVEIRHHERIFLDELPDGPFANRKENVSCGPECGWQPSLFGLGNG